MLNTKENFCGGKVSSFFEKWTELTSDKYLLDIVRGYNIEFVDLPSQNKLPKQLKFSELEHKQINEQITNFIDKGIVEKASDESGEFISNIFYRPKKDGTVRVILNLKELNNDVEYHHFKMETLKSALSLVKKNCFFGSIDLTDAYFSVNVNPLYRKYLRFIREGVKYQFTCLPNGLSSKIGHVNLAYIDDSLLIGDTYQKCLVNIADTCTLIDSLGFTIHQNKSVFVPSQIIIFLTPKI